MTEQPIQTMMIPSDPDDRRRLGWQAATSRASDPDGIDYARAPIRAIQRLAPGGRLAFINRSKAAAYIGLGGSARSIPAGERQTFGPIHEGPLYLSIQPIKEDGRPDRSPSIIDIEIAPSAGFGDGPIIDDRSETICEWDGSQTWWDGIPCRGEQPGQIAR